MESVDPLLTNKKMSDYDISSSSSSSEIFEISDEEPALKKRKYKEWAVDQSKPVSKNLNFYSYALNKVT